MGDWNDAKGNIAEDLVAAVEAMRRPLPGPEDAWRWFEDTLRAARQAREAREAKGARPPPVVHKR